jgi:hypothetical protein
MMTPPAMEITDLGTGDGVTFTPEGDPGRNFASLLADGFSPDISEGGENSAALGDDGQIWV